MKFPESWLREHVKVTASREQLADTLTAIGLEVEACEAIGADLPGVIVAEIISCEKHPQAERLQICQVNTGSQTVQIVCGAPNARAGLKAPLAMPGAQLPNGIEIKAAKLRGVESTGMLCSAKELGIDADASGLLELPENAPVGTKIADYLGLPDARFELKLTPNRADCFSIRGVAYDVAAALSVQVEPITISAYPIDTNARFDVSLSAGAGCPRYCGRFIEGLNTDARSPLWLTEKLKRAGLRPISPLVDITNFIMLELGQPMHAFDADQLHGPIGVRLARKGEKLKLLDEREVVLDDGFLAITDADRIVALAGVMGGWDTRVTAATSRVFLEAAHFAPEAIIGRSRKLGMHTDAAHRFERGVDPDLPRQAIERATALIIQIMGGWVGPISEAVNDQLPVRHAVQLRREHLQRMLGVTVADARVEQIFTSLGMQVLANNEGWQITAPARRFDIAIEEDLIEEVARIYGYDAITAALPSGQIRVVAPTESRLHDGEIRRQLIARDFLETINYAFIDPALLRGWSLDADAVTLANPLASDLAQMRTWLLPGLVQTLQRNLARQESRIRLFEIGRVFHAGNGVPIESRHLAAIACGTVQAEQWACEKRNVDFYDLKAEVEAIGQRIGANLRFDAQTPSWGHPGRSASIFRNDQYVGWVGHLHPALLADLDIAIDVIGFELDLEILTERTVPRAVELSKFPFIRRDIAFIVSQSTPWAAIELTARQALGQQLSGLRLFDRYQGKGLEEGTKSVAMGLILQEVSRTLTDADADAAVAAVVAALTREHGARLRG